MTTEARVVDPLTGFFVITGRGVVFTSVERDPLYEPGETVALAGLPCKVLGIERQGFPRPGANIGLLLKPSDDPKQAEQAAIAERERREHEVRGALRDIVYGLGGDGQQLQQAVAAVLRVL